MALPVYIGRVYVKQAALTAARDLLAMAIQGVNLLHQHLEEVAEEARKTIRSRAVLVDPYIEKAKKP